RARSWEIGCHGDFVRWRRDRSWEQKRSEAILVARSFSIQSSFSLVAVDDAFRKAAARIEAVGRIPAAIVSQVIMAATDQHDRVGLEPPIARVSPDREVDIGTIARVSVERQTFAGLFALPKNGGGLDRSAPGFLTYVRARFHSRWLTRILHFL